MSKTCRLQGYVAIAEALLAVEFRVEGSGRSWEGGIRNGGCWGGKCRMMCDALSQTLQFQACAFAPSLSCLLPTKCVYAKNNYPCLACQPLSV